LSADYGDSPLYNSTFDNKFTRLQDKLLGGQYMDRTKFENLTSEECMSRYGAQFITSGAGFGVQLEKRASRSNSSLIFNLPEGSGNLMLDNIPMYGGDEWLSCE
jgi:hypothetical protein